MGYEQAKKAVLKAAAKRSVKASSQSLSQAKRFQSTLSTMNASVQRGDPVPVKDIKKLATQVETWYRNLMKTYGGLFTTAPTVKESILHAQTLRQNADEMAFDTQRIEGGGGNASKRQQHYLAQMTPAIAAFMQSFTRAVNSGAVKHSVKADTPESLRADVIKLMDEMRALITMTKPWKWDKESSLKKGDAIVAECRRLASRAANILPQNNYKRNVISDLSRVASQLPLALQGHNRTTPNGSPASNQQWIVSQLASLQSARDGILWAIKKD